MKVKMGASKVSINIFKTRWNFNAFHMEPNDWICSCWFIFFRETSVGWLKLADIRQKDAIARILLKSQVQGLQMACLDTVHDNLPLTVKPFHD